MSDVSKTKFRSRDECSAIRLALKRKNKARILLTRTASHNRSKTMLSREIEIDQDKMIRQNNLQVMVEMLLDGCV